ncbi:hypothetical protein AYI70_g8993 [Smittium culicis]|uniref:Uncharacterized protein n=1 Tax=Smittium culicis TaxID=133412 RepID=A0A1R1XDB3_9FUNG|nr:hypothetical protein AYI70_g8993 [Smittium culicis]
MDTPASKKFTLKLGTGFQHAKLTNSTGSRKSFQSIADGPVYDKNKNLTAEKHEKIKIWTNHFGELIKYATGNSRCADKWENLIPSDCDYYPECDNSI